MRAIYDIGADAISIEVIDLVNPERQHLVHERAIVATVGGRAIEVQVLRPRDGLDDPLAAVAEAFDLDLSELSAAAQAALAAPNRVVSLELLERRPKR